MSIPPCIVNSARMGWRWEWKQLMNGLGPSDANGSYQRPPSQLQNAKVPLAQDLLKRPKAQIPRLIIGRSCPWAHRTWLVYELRQLQNTLSILISKADHNAGRWAIEPPWLECDSLLDLSLIHI